MKKILLLSTLLLSLQSHALILNGGLSCAQSMVATSLDCAKEALELLPFSTTSLPTVLIFDDENQVQTEDFIAELLIETAEIDKPFTTSFAEYLNISTKDLSNSIETSIEQKGEVDLQEILKEFL